MRPSFTLGLGIEEEYQTIDPETRDLRSHVETELLSEGKKQLRERVKAELHQSVVEVGTGICKDVQAVRADMLELRHNMFLWPRTTPSRLGAASTHPFADWKTQQIYPDERYMTIVEDMQTVARANLILGLHDMSASKIAKPRSTY